jgi:hypothetical protein
MGEGQGFLADMPPADILSVVKRATFLDKFMQYLRLKIKSR